MSLTQYRNIKIGSVDLNFIDSLNIPGGGGDFFTLKFNMYENDMRPLDQTVTFLTCVDARMLWFEKVLSFQLPSISAVTIRQIVTDSCVSGNIFMLRY